MLSPSQKLPMSMLNKRIFAPVLLISAFILNPSVSFAEMYKWVDEEGNTHYTQSPPPGDIEAKTIKPPPEINSEYEQKQIQGRQELLDDWQKAREEKKQAELKQQQEAEEKAAKCEQARKRLASYQRPRIMIKDADGNPTRIGEDKRMAELEKSRELVKQLCGD